MREKFLQELLRLAPFGCAYHQLVVDDQGKAEDYIFLEVNPAFEEITGLKGESILGKRVTEVLPGIRTGSCDWVDLYGKVVLTGEKLEITQYAESLERWYKIIAFSPEKGHFATVFQETTYEVAWNLEQEKKEKAKERIFSDLETIFNSTQDAMFLARIEDGNFRYMMNNTAHRELTGFSSEEIEDKTPEELLGIEAAKMLKANYLRAVLEKCPVQTEETIAFPKGEKTWQTILSPVLEEGEVKYIIGSRKDITLQKKAEKEKENLFQRLQAMFNGHAAVMLLIDPETGKIADANPAACDFYGYSREELLNIYIQDLNMLSREEVEKQRLKAKKEKQRYFIFPHRLKSGEVKLVDVYSSAILQNGSTMLFSIIFDVTDREKYKEELFREKELLRTTLLSIGDGVVTTDYEGKIVVMNKFAQEISGWHEEEATGKPFQQFFKMVSEETGAGVEDPVAKVLQMDKIVGLANHTALITKTGEKVPIADSAAPIKNDKGETFGVVMVFRDVSKEKKQQEKILYLSYRDHLTGLYNRRFMEEQIELLDIAENLPLAVVMGDVNGLKLINDVFSHQAGDNLLQKVAEVLKGNCRTEDIIARWGGDEFLILLPRTTEEQVEKIIQRIKSNCTDLSDGNMQISVSLGGAVKTEKEESFQRVLKTAEEWMYHQKLLEGKSYRNTIINTLLSTLFEKSNETEEHAERLKEYCIKIGGKLNLAAKELDELTLLAMLHDIGKVGIKESILQKPGFLTLQEWDEMKKHPEIGYRIAQNAPELASVAEYILSHHERWDGKGYPRGIEGEEIPLLCRILAVADAYDAMTNDRSYRKAMTKEEALTELRLNAGTQFDPFVIDITIGLLEYQDTGSLERGSLS